MVTPITFLNKSPASGSISAGSLRPMSGLQLNRCHLNHSTLSPHFRPEINTGALLIRIGFGGMLYRFFSVRNPKNPILNIKAPALCYKTPTLNLTQILSHGNTKTTSEPGEGLCTVGALIIKIGFWVEYNIPPSPILVIKAPELPDIG